jgi:hypothetical protein
MEKRGRCPFDKKECKTDCTLYRKGIRFFDDGKKQEPFEECAINIGVDCMEQMVSRSIGQQRATEEARNETKKLLGFFEGMVSLKKMIGGAEL